LCVWRLCQVLEEFPTRVVCRALSKSTGQRYSTGLAGTPLVGFQHRRIGLDGDHNVLVAVALARLADRQLAWYPPFPSPQTEKWRKLCFAPGGLCPIGSQ